MLGVTMLVWCAFGQLKIEEHLASKCPYRPLGSLEAQTPLPSQGCFPLHLNLIARHGNRNPGDGDIEEFIRIEQTVKAYSSKIRYDWMKKFTNPVPIEDEGKLVLGGQNEHYNLAKRFSKAFPELFKQSYNSDIYFMRATQEQRAMMSGDTFAYGLFERKGQVGQDFYEPHFILSDSEDRDNILKYYDNCELYTRLVDENETAKIEADLYLERILPAIAYRLTPIVTIDGSWNITGDDVLAFHALCQTQAAIFSNSKEFCTLFTEREILNLEYWEDLDDYYGKSYAYPINYQMTIPLIQDVIYSMVAASQGETRQKTNLRFAHSSTVVPLAAVFGLYKDGQDLRHDSPQDFIDNRKFRTSNISTMGTNFAFVLYECGEDDYQVKVLQNEKEMVIAGCPGVYCPLKTLLSAYDFYINTEFDELCQNP